MCLRWLPGLGSRKSNHRSRRLLSQHSPTMLSLIFLARVPLCYHPCISVVSRRFRSLVASPELYEARRSLLGCTEEYCLYVVLRNMESSEDRVYTLRRKPNGDHRLVLIPSLPAMPNEGSFVGVGSRIHVFGGFDRQGRTSSALSIDCRYHMVRPLPNMPVPMAESVADIMDGKIYVLGNADYNSRVMLVFNTETQMWDEPRLRRNAVLGELDWLSHRLHGCVVMAEKMYTRISFSSYVYEPQESTWKMDRRLNFNKWKNACVVDDRLYYYDRVDNIITAYDPKLGFWEKVKGVEELLDETRHSVGWARTVSYGGKLLLLFFKNINRLKELWCAEITLQEYPDKWYSNICGKVDWCHVVIVGNFYVVESIAAMRLSDMMLDMSSKIRAEKEKEHPPEPTCLITSLPDKVVVDIIARVPICYHPSISVVSRRFRSLIVSPELYAARRSLVGCNEPCVYLVLQNKENSENRVYILRDDRRLVLIPSLPAMPYQGSFVTVGSRIHVFGGRYKHNSGNLHYFTNYGKTSNALSIDCRYHTVQPLPGMPVPMAGTVADIIDGKIYVFGYTGHNSSVMVVFNTKTQMWEPRMMEL